MNFILLNRRDSSKNMFHFLGWVEHGDHWIYTLSWKTSYIWNNELNVKKLKNNNRTKEVKCCFRAEKAFQIKTLNPQRMNTINRCWK